MADEFEVKLPDYLEGGVYANSVLPWNTRTEFTLDFLAYPADRKTPDVGRVVSRVKIPTMFMFRLIQELNASMTDYEEKYGEIK